MMIQTIDHWPLWTEFVKAETDAHGPDPQFELLLELVPEATEIEKVWLAGCYGAHHCVPSAYAVWREFRPRDVIAVGGYEKLHEWLKEHWTALPVRPEMRSHRMVAKRAECLAGFADYALSESWRTGSYQTIWDDSIDSVKYYSRYMALKYLEMLRRIARPDMVSFDMRAKNAWSPRITLGLLFPNSASILSDKGNNSSDAVELAESCATLTKLQLERSGINLNYFQLQVLLCEYREALVGGYYPGAGHSEEMDYIKIAESKFDMSHVWNTRKRIFQHQYLGELNGWYGIQEENFLIWKNKGKAMGFI